jgi:hypothetical protein
VTYVRWIAAAVLVGGLAVSFAGSAAATTAAGRGGAGGAATSMSSAVTVIVRQPAGDLRSFWTPQRLAAARVLALPSGEAGGPASGPQPATPQPARPQSATPQVAAAPVLE